MSGRDVAGTNDFQDADVWHGRPLFFIVLALFSGGICVAIIFGWPRMSAFSQILAPLGALVFVWAFVRSVINALHGRHVMLAIGPRGIFDWRVAPDWMPWAAVVEIPAIDKGGKMRGFRIKTNAEFSAGFRETIMSCLLRCSNIVTTIRGYTVGFGGLDGSADDIMRALDQYFPQWRNAKTIT